MVPSSRGMIQPGFVARPLHSDPLQQSVEEWIKKQPTPIPSHSSGNSLSNPFGKKGKKKKLLESQEKITDTDLKEEVDEPDSYLLD